MLTSLQISTLLKLKVITRKSLIKIGGKLNSALSDNIDLVEFINNNISDESKKFTLSEYISELEKVHTVFEKSSEVNIQAINYWEPNFPKLLLEIPDPPILLHYKGNLDSTLDFPTVAIIGTRNPTPYGYKIAERISERITESGITIVSGLATGCDQGAHMGCLAAKGKTVAILAHGLQMIYPKSNFKLAQDIVENNGCLLSEYIYGSEIDRFNFVERDRLQSGLSFATIVIETDIKGGTMHTVKFTLKQNRMLYCFNHPLEKRSDTSQGNQLLLNNGDAIPINSLEDLNELINTVKNKFFQLSINENNYRKELVKLTENPSLNTSSTNVRTCSFEDLAKRLKLKTIKSIKEHLKKGDFNSWIIKKDPDNLDWKFEEEKNQFTVIVEKTLFE